MNVEYTFLKTPDGLLLDGYYISSKGKKGFIHLHGLTSRIRPIKKLEEMAKVLPKKGYHVLFFNNRGFGNVNRVSFADKKKKGKSGKFIGGALEKFEECIYDIQGAVNFLKRKGCTKIFISGHSTGCQKSAYYMIKDPDKRVKGVVFQSPANDTEGEILHSGKKGFLAMFQKAERLVKSGKKDEIMGRFSAGRFYNLHRKGSIEGRLFDYTGKRLSDISRIKVPILVILGEKDEYITPGSCLEKLKLIKESANVPCRTIMLKDAPHSFKGKHKQIVKMIADWLEKQ